MPTFQHYFYHAFPRRDQRNGIMVLQSIINSGLLLVLEVLDTPPFADRDFGANVTSQIRLHQVRACFTELPPPEVGNHPNEFDYHASKFGKFAIEFDASSIRQIGALPVYYIPAPSNIAAAEDIGVHMVKHLLDVKTWLEGEQIMNSDPRRLKQIQALRRVTDQFYPTDRGRIAEPMEYFQQREWRITTALMPDGSCEAPNPEEKEFLERLDPSFFGRVFSGVPPVNGGPAVLGEPRSSHCEFLRAVGNQHVLSFARRIICPTAHVERVRQMLQDRNFDTRVLGYDPSPIVATGGGPGTPHTRCILARCCQAVCRALRRRDTGPLDQQN